MGLPQAIQKQLDVANAVESQITGVTPPPTDPPADPPTPPAAEPPAGNPPPAAPPAAPPVSGGEDFAQLYQSLKGKYDAEVPQLHAQLQTLTAELQQARMQSAEILQRMHAMSQQQAQKQEPPKQEPPKQLVTQAEIERFGPDLADFISRRAAEVNAGLQQENSNLAQMVQGLHAELAEMKRVVAGVHQDVQQTQGATYEDHLTREVADWRALDRDPGFHQWLQQVEPMVGVPRLQLLRNAHDAKNVAQVAFIFKAYKQTLTPPAPPAAPAQSQAQRELARQVAPSTTRGQAPPSSGTDDGFVTLKEMEEFYTAVRKGEFSGREAEMKAIEAKIDAAAAAGKIR